MQGEVYHGRVIGLRWNPDLGRECYNSCYDATLNKGKPMSDIHFYRSLAQAIDHAEEVARRRHIKAERYERIGQFMTSLRSYLTKPGYGSSGVYEAAMNKAVWYDIGVMEATHNIRGVQSHHIELLRDALLKAQPYRSCDADHESPESIREDLRDLRSELTMQQQQVNRMDSLNTRADDVVEKMADLAERAVA